MGRHSKEIEPTAEGAPLGNFLRNLQAASGMTWRELGSASHMSYTTLSQGADGRLAGRWETVALWLRAFYRAVNVETVAGWGLEAALAHAHTLWLYCRECARLQKPPIDNIEISMAMPTLTTGAGAPDLPLTGQSIVMEIRKVVEPTQLATVTPLTEASTRGALAPLTGAHEQEVGLQNLHEARNAVEFLAAIEDARVAAGLSWADLVRALLRDGPTPNRGAAMAG